MILLLKGLPGSGKTTFRIKWLADAAETRRAISYDEARLSLYGAGWKFNGPEEDAMRKHCVEAVEKWLTEGMDVCIDNTNLTAGHVEKWRQLALTFKTGFQIHSIDTPVHVCVDADRNRTKRVGRAVIEGMALRNGHINWSDYSLYDDLNFVVVDVDGTLADLSHRRPCLDRACSNCGKVNPTLTRDGKCGEGLFPIDKALKSGGLCGGDVSKKDYDKFFAEAANDKPFNDIIKLVRTLDETHNILIVSGRPDDKAGIATEDWLLRHGVPCEHLFMRRGGDYRPDDIVKEEILAMLPKQRIAFVLDDRDRVVQMWRKNGLRCLQVANGAF